MWADIRNQEATEVGERENLGETLISERELICNKYLLYATLDSLYIFNYYNRKDIIISTL